MRNSCATSVGKNGAVGARVVVVLDSVVGLDGKELNKILIAILKLEGRAHALVFSNFWRFLFGHLRAGRPLILILFFHLQIL